MEEKIISTYAKGMTTADIESHMRDPYDIEISDSTISRITDKILPIVNEWQERPLEEVYAVVFMDAIHFHVRSEGRVVKCAVSLQSALICLVKRMFSACMSEKMKVPSSGFLL
jgi:transposase, mutator family